jgi:hypothetical protein
LWCIVGFWVFVWFCMWLNDHLWTSSGVVVPCGVMPVTLPRLTHAASYAHTNTCTNSERIGQGLEVRGLHGRAPQRQGRRACLPG